VLLATAWQLETLLEVQRPSTPPLSWKPRMAPHAPGHAPEPAP
jgi:hypothetical protein